MAYNTQPTTTGKKNPMETKAEGAAARVTGDRTARPKPRPQKKEWTKKSPKSKIDWTNTAKPPKPGPKSMLDQKLPKKRTIQDKKSTRHDAPVKRETMTRTVTQKTGPGLRIKRPSQPSTPASQAAAKPVKKPTGGKKRIQQQERDFGPAR